MPVTALALALAACNKPAHEKEQRAPTGGGIVSLSPCADQLLVALTPSRRIAAISRFSRDPAASALPPDVALRFRSAGGTARDVLALKPTLALAASTTPPTIRDAFTRAHLNVLYLDIPTTIAGSEAQVSDVAAAIDENEAGKALDARIGHAVGGATRRGGGIPALILTGGNRVVREGTLLDEMLTRAGFRNAAADYGSQRDGTAVSEALAAHPPRVIFAAADDRSATARAQALAHGNARVLVADFPVRAAACGGPAIITAMARLANAQEQLMH